MQLARQPIGAPRRPPLPRREFQKRKAKAGVTLNVCLPGPGATATRRWVLWSPPVGSAALPSGGRPPLH